MFVTSSTVAVLVECLLHEADGIDVVKHLHAAVVRPGFIQAAVKIVLGLLRGVLPNSRAYNVKQLECSDRPQSCNNAVAWLSPIRAGLT